jgi:PAS domain S-box-containing protein
MATTEGPAHTVRSVNPAFCALQGMHADAMIGLPISEAITGAGAANVLALLERVYGGEKSGFVNTLQYSEPGHNLTYKSYMVWNLPDTEDHMEGLVIQVTDFTEQALAGERTDRTTAEILDLNSEMREVNEQLVISGLQQHILADMAAGAERRLRNIVHGLNAIICEVDAVTGKFTYVSEQAETFLGYPVQRWTDEGFWKQVIYEEDYERALVGLRKAGSSQDVHQFAFRVTAANGSQIWLRNIMKAVKDADGAVTGYRCIIVDVTQQQTDHLALVKDLARNQAIADALQYSILWRHPEKSFHSLKVAAFYEPAMDEALVGGDLFDAFSLPNKSIMLVVGDVTGKGLKAAAHVAEIIFAVRAFAQDYHDPADVLTRLNEFICNFHREYDGDSNALVVLLIVVIDPTTGATRAASAGGEPPFILRASGAAEEMAVRGLILGIDSNARYEAEELSLEEGDLLLISTDGLTETRRGDDFFGYERLLDVARAAEASAPLPDIGKAILETARAYGGGRFKDDVCLLLARRDGSVPSGVERKPLGRLG